MTEFIDLERLQVRDLSGTIVRLSSLIAQPIPELGPSVASDFRLPRQILLVCLRHLA